MSDIGRQTSGHTAVRNGYQNGANGEGARMKPKGPESMRLAWQP